MLVKRYSERVLRIGRRGRCTVSRNHEFNGRDYIVVWRFGSMLFDEGVGVWAGLKWHPLEGLCFLWLGIEWWCVVCCVVQVLVQVVLLRGWASVWDVTKWLDVCFSLMLMIGGEFWQSQTIMGVCVCVNVWIKVFLCIFVTVSVFAGVQVWSYTLQRETNKLLQLVCDFLTILIKILVSDLVCTSLIL